MHFLDGLHDLTTPDLAAALEPFGTEAVYQSLVPRRRPLRGKAAIRTELEQQFTRDQECVCEIVAIRVERPVRVHRAVATTSR